MSLDAAARRRFARHLLLAEIGESGQEHLVGARFRKAAPSDADAYSAAADYLERAGYVSDPSGVDVRAPGPASVQRFAGSPALAEPAALIIGAFCAVEHIKETLGIAAACEFPSDLRLGDGN